MPVFGAVCVVALNPKGFEDSTGFVDDLKRIASSVLTLGSGVSLGPEAGCIGEKDKTLTFSLLRRHRAVAADPMTIEAV